MCERECVCVCVRSLQGQVLPVSHEHMKNLCESVGNCFSGKSNYILSSLCINSLIIGSNKMNDSD